MCWSLFILVGYVFIVCRPESSVSSTACVWSGSYKTCSPKKRVSLFEANI